MIDTHCHLTYDGIVERIDEVIAAARAAGVDRMICIGTDMDDARRAVALAERFEGVFASVGVHPGHSDRGIDTVALRELAQHPKVVALGEMGLDSHYPEPSPEVQRAVFAAQLELMRDFRGPGVIHSRETTPELVATIRASGLPGDRFVFHCFTGTAEERDLILDLGAMVSITGIATFKNASEVAAMSDGIPLERLMIETDSPYLTPAPHRKVRTNEPKYVVHVAEFLAQRRGMSPEDFTRVMDANAERFFQLLGR